MSTGQVREGQTGPPGTAPSQAGCSSPRGGGGPGSQEGGGSRPTVPVRSPAGSEGTKWHLPLRFLPEPIAQSEQEESLRLVPTEDVLPSRGHWAAPPEPSPSPGGRAVGASPPPRSPWGVRPWDGGQTPGKQGAWRSEAQGLACARTWRMPTAPQGLGDAQGKPACGALIRRCSNSGPFESLRLAHCPC